MLLVGFGTAFFLFGHDPLASPYGRRVTACALLLHLLIDLVLPILSYLRAPDWMWGYLVPDANALPAWLPVWVFFLYNVPFGFAFLLGARLSTRGWKSSGTAFLLALAAQVSIIAVSADRTLVVGTTAEFLAGTARPIPESALAPIYNVGGGVAAVVVVSVLAFLVRSYRAQQEAGPRLTSP